MEGDAAPIQEEPFDSKAMPGPVVLRQETPGDGFGRMAAGHKKKRDLRVSLSFPPNPQPTNHILSPPPTACDSSNFLRKLLPDNFPLESCHRVLATKDVRRQLPRGLERVEKQKEEPDPMHSRFISTRLRQTVAARPQ